MADMGERMLAQGEELLDVPVPPQRTLKVPQFKNIHSDARSYPVGVEANSDVGGEADGENMIDSSADAGKSMEVSIVAERHSTGLKVSVGSKPPSIDETAIPLEDHVHKNLEVGEESSFRVWGVVTFVIHKV